LEKREKRRIFSTTVDQMHRRLPTTKYVDLKIFFDVRFWSGSYKLLVFIWVRWLVFSNWKIIAVIHTCEVYFPHWKFSVWRTRSMSCDFILDTHVQNTLHVQRSIIFWRFQRVNNHNTAHVFLVFNKRRLTRNRLARAQNGIPFGFRHKSKTCRFR